MSSVLAEGARVPGHVLVTGARSYVARSIIDTLLARGARVSATFRGAAPTIDGVELFPVDLCRATDFDRLPARVDAVVHIAAATPPDALDEIVRASADGTLHVQRYARRSGAERIVIASTLSVHGRVEGSVVDERTPCNNPGAYGAAKLLAERILMATAGELPAAAIRLPSVLGDPAAKPWLPTLARKLKAHEDVELFNPDAPFNNAVDVTSLAEFVAALSMARFTGFHAFPIAASGSMPVSAVVERLRQSTGSRSTIRVAAADRRSFIISSDYAARTFDYRALTIDETLQRFAKLLR